MQVETTKKRFTADEYHRLAETGILHPEDRTELIDGEIIQMSPIGGRHMAVVDRLARLFILTLHQSTIARIQGSIRLTNFTEPQPDVILLKYRPDFYSEGRAHPADALLVVEVSDTTFRYDRYVKLPHYAAAGIPEYWIANLKRDELLVFCDPTGEAYAAERTLHPSDSVSVAAFPDHAFTVAEILGVLGTRT